MTSRRRRRLAFRGGGRSSAALWRLKYYIGIGEGNEILFQLHMFISNTDTQTRSNVYAVSEDAGGDGLLQQYTIILYDIGASSPAD